MRKLICGAIETSLVITIVLMGAALLISCVLPAGGGEAANAIVPGGTPGAPAGLPLDLTTVGGAIGAAAVVGDYIRRIIKGRSVKKSLTVADEQLSNVMELLGRAKEVEAVIVTAVEEIRKSSAESKASFTTAVNKALADSDLTTNELKTYIASTKVENGI